MKTEEAIIFLMLWKHMSVICVQVITAYREVLNNLNLTVVTEKWTDLLCQLDKFEQEIGSGRYFGGEKN